MYAAKDLQHDFEVEPLLNEFVISVGGELVSNLISGNPDFKNADYVFKSRRVVIELKSLQEDFALPEKLSDKKLELWKKWFSEGEVKFRHIFHTNELPIEKRRQLVRLYSEPIRRVLKKANRQLRTTAQKLGIGESQNLLLIANDGLYSLEPDVVIAIIAQLLEREFSSIHGFVYFTINRYVELSEDNIAHHLWIPLYSETAHDDLVDFVDDLGVKWFDFLGQKIGGWETPLMRTGDRAILRGVRNIRP
jgi:hypothetical protein